MTPSDAEAQGLARADKHPKSTRYGRQNPISERWNSEEQLAAWRAAWADMSSRCLEHAGREERIDHRSNAAQRQAGNIPPARRGYKRTAGTADDTVAGSTAEKAAAQRTGKERL